MTELKFTKVTEIYAQDICQKLELSDEATQLLTQDLSPAAYLEKLIAEELFPDAVRFLAMALPKREGTWWACLAARHTLPKNADAREIAAIEAAETWVYRPSEANRQLTQAVAEATEFKTAAGWAAIAAFWSGGSISPVPDVMVPPPEDLTAKAVGGAIMLAAASGDPAKINSHYQVFLQQGLNIACGGDGRSVL
jgi:hypothetical protein